MGEKLESHGRQMVEDMPGQYHGRKEFDKFSQFLKYKLAFDIAVKFIYTEFFLSSLNCTFPACVIRSNNCLTLNVDNLYLFKNLFLPEICQFYCCFKESTSCFTCFLFLLLIALTSAQSLPFPIICSPCCFQADKVRLFIYNASWARESTEQLRMFAAQS